MAVNPRTTYAAQTVDDANYPYGKARNVTVARDGTGTPLEKAWVNDLWGFLQSLLSAASIVPTNTPDQLGASQYLDAVKYLIANVAEDVTFSGLVRFNAAITAMAAAAFEAAVTFGAPVTFEDTAAFSGNVDHSGDDTWHNRNTIFKDAGGATIGTIGAGAGLIWTLLAGFSNEIVLTGAGRIRQNVAIAPDADHTYSEGDATVIVWGSGIAATRTIKFNNAASVGAKIRLVNYSAHAMTLQNQAGGSLILAPTLPAVASFRPGVMDLIWVNNGTYTGWSEG
jgi:hypothetical protein